MICFYIALFAVNPYFFSTRAIPHLGQSPGLSLTTSECIGQVYCTFATSFELPVFSCAGLFPHELNINPASRTNPKTNRFLFIVINIKIVSNKRLCGKKRLLQLRFVSHLQYRRTGKISDTKNTNAGEVHISGHQCPRGAFI